MHTSRAIWFGAIFAAALPAGCGPVPAGGPAKKVVPKLPVTTAFRNSHVGKGMVLRIRNDSDETLPNLCVIVRTAKWGDNSKLTRQVAEDVKPGKIVEVGWQQLNGWQLSPGEQVEICCVGGKEYETLTVRVPEKPSN